MQQLTLLVKVLPSLYRLGSEAVYVYLPEDGTGAVCESNALDLFNNGGTFIYLRYPIEEHQNLLLTYVKRLSDRPSLLFLDNDSDYVRHWNMKGWYLRDGKMRQVGILDIYGFRIIISGGSEVEAVQEGIYLKDIRFGKNEMEECRDALFSWDGHFKFMVHAGRILWQEAQIRYELSEYDVVTQRYLSKVCNTGEPQWNGINVERKAFATNDLWAQGTLFWDISKETDFVFPGGTVLYITGFPEIRMETLAFRFTKGSEEYFLAAFGKGVFLNDADVGMGIKGVFHIRQGDRVEMLIEPEGCLEERQGCAEVSMLKIQAPFAAAGIEAEVNTSVPILPKQGIKGRREAELFLNRRLRENVKAACHKNVWFNKEKFEICICKSEILWVNLYGQDKEIPGIALCSPECGLAGALMADEFFVVLDAGDRNLFSIPYTINESNLLNAARMGYPEEECSRLKNYCSIGQMFLSEASFRFAIEKAGCVYKESLKQACHHFQLTSGERSFSFSPDSWEERGIVLAVKKGGTLSIAELTDDMDMWSFLPENKTMDKQLLDEICVKVHGTEWEAVFTEPEWEGSIIINREAGQDDRIEFLILPAGEGREILTGII